MRRVLGPHREICAEPESGSTLAPMAPTATPPTEAPPRRLGPDLLHDHRLTAMGLLVEAHAGIMDVVARDLSTVGAQVSSFEVLLRLARSPDHRLRMSELAAQTSVTNSGLTRLIDRLVAAGLVERSICETDRRGYYATLTQEGLDRLAAALPTHLDTIDRVLTGVLRHDELEGFISTLRKLRAVVNPASDPDHTAPLAEG